MNRFEPSMMTLRSGLIAALLPLLLLAGCRPDTLKEQPPQLLISAQPTAQQSAPSEWNRPPAEAGIDIGDAPLRATASATFVLHNDGVSLIKIASLQSASRRFITSHSNGSFSLRIWIAEQEVSEARFELTANQDARVRVEFVPDGDGVVGEALLEFHNETRPGAGPLATAHVRGTGLFVGNPNLEVEYGGATYPLPESCTAGTGPGGLSLCVLPALSFGNVSLDNSATAPVTLRNNPLPGTCQVLDCTPACPINFAADTAAYNLGVGFAPADQGFAPFGITTIPFVLAPARPDCVQEQGLARGDVRMLVNFDAGPIERDAASILVLESDDPDAPLIHIPVQAAVRETPVAIAGLRHCGPDAPVTACSETDLLAPLGRAYFDGRAQGSSATSHDPRDPTDINLITAYRWELIEWPDAAQVQAGDLSIFQLNDNGLGLADIYLPAAGRYTLRLHVTNDLGVESGISDTSDISIDVLPSSRLHIQLTWGDPVSDLDIHLTRAEVFEGPFHAQGDCFWLQCRPSCANDSRCEPVQWFTDVPPFDGPNPSLDLDDEHGFGPENLNIRRPAEGHYNIFVHDYSFTNVDTPDTEAVVRVYLDGAVVGEFRRVLSWNDLWAVAQLQVDAAGSAVLLPAQSDNGTQVGTVVELSYLPFPGGYAFDVSPFQ